LLLADETLMISAKQDPLSEFEPEKPVVRHIEEARATFVRERASTAKLDRRIAPPVGTRPAIAARALQSPSVSRPPTVGRERGFGFTDRRWLWLLAFGSAFVGALGFLIVARIGIAPPTPRQSTPVPLVSSALPAALTMAPFLIREQKSVPRTTRSVTRQPRIAAAVLRTPTAGPQFFGSLVIVSTPERAHAFVNGVPVGITPLVLTDLPVGSRTIRVEADGYTAWSSTMQVVADQTTSVTATLSRPEDASVVQP
jgi:hypothetical protein